MRQPLHLLISPFCGMQPAHDHPTFKAGGAGEGLAGMVLLSYKADVYGVCPSAAILLSHVVPVPGCRAPQVACAKCEVPCSNCTAVAA